MVERAASKNLAPTPEVELVAKALFGYVHCPGTPWDSIPWPPAHRPSLVGYLNRAEAIVKAQKEHPL
jgi:hypothetical protein